MTSIRFCFCAISISLLLASCGEESTIGEACFSDVACDSDQICVMGVCDWRSRYDSGVDGATDAAADASDDGATDAAPDASGDGAVDAAGDGATDAATDATPDATADVAPSDATMD